MTPHCPGAGKRRFWCKTMAQYGTVCNICPSHLTMTYMLCHPWHHDGTHVTYDTDMESMTPSWRQQWHHAVLELGKDNSGAKQWHNMAQYVIYVLATQHDVYAMSPMTPRCHSCHIWHRHWINDTLSWSWWNGRHSWCKTMVTYAWHSHVIYVLPTSPWRTMPYCHPLTPRWHSCHLCAQTVESMTPWVA